jgi:hypothetical protein
MKDCRHINVRWSKHYAMVCVLRVIHPLMAILSMGNDYYHYIMIYHIYIYNLYIYIIIYPI